MGYTSGSASDNGKPVDFPTRVASFSGYLHDDPARLMPRAHLSLTPAPPQLAGWRGDSFQRTSGFYGLSALANLFFRTGMTVTGNVQLVIGRGHNASFSASGSFEGGMNDELKMLKGSFDLTLKAKPYNDLKLNGLFILKNRNEALFITPPFTDDEGMELLPVFISAGMMHRV